MSRKAAKKRSHPAPKRRRRRRNKALAPMGGTSNPPIMTDLAEMIGPGFASYVVTRFLGRIVYQTVGKKWPKLGKHAHVASQVVAAGGVWFAGHRIKQLAKYHDSLVVGASIAALQSAAQAYLPKYGWIVGDVEAPAANAEAALPPPSEDELENMIDAAEANQPGTGADEAEDLDNLVDFPGIS
jgi:hypothetical protein